MPRVALSSANSTTLRIEGTTEMRRSARMRSERSTCRPSPVGAGGDHDDGEVENVPAAAEEAQAVGEELERELDDEDRERGAIEREQQAASLRHGGGEVSRPRVIALTMITATMKRWKAADSTRRWRVAVIVSDFGRVGGGEFGGGGWFVVSDRGLRRSYGAGLDLVRFPVGATQVAMARRWGADAAFVAPPPSRLFASARLGLGRFLFLPRRAPPQAGEHRAGEDGGDH